MIRLVGKLDKNGKFMLSHVTMAEGKAWRLCDNLGDGKYYECPMDSDLGKNNDFTKHLKSPPGKK